MKHFFLFLLLVSTGLTQNAIAQVNKNQLNGSWIFNYEKSMGVMDSNAKSHYQKMKTEKKDKVRSNYEGRVISFNDNGEFNQKLTTGKEFSGKWDLHDNGEIIIITDARGVLREYKIVSISSSELILIPKIEGDYKPLISEWHFIKSN